MLSIALLTTLFQAIHSGTTTCYDYKSCYGQTEYEIGGTLLCMGYQACMYGKQWADTVQCDGCNACLGSSQIKGTNGGTVYCRGRNGCTYADEILTEGLVDCTGDQGCVGVDRIAAATVDCSGAEGCQSSLIEPYGTDPFTVLATGEDSMAGATIDCSKEDLESCAVTCYGTGCQGLTIVYNEKRDEIDLTPAGCKATANQGQDIGSSEVVIYCPTLVAKADYSPPTKRQHHKNEEEGEQPMQLFVDAAGDGNKFLSSSRPMDAKDLLFYGSMVVNGVFMVTCAYKRYRKNKEYLTL